MKSKICISFIIIYTLALIILSILGNKTRKGYLSEFKFDEIHINQTLELNNLDIEETKKLFTIDNQLDNNALINYIFTNEAITNYNYGFKLKYYSKIFRHSDIYGVYIDTNKVLQDNSFIKEINMDKNGSPFGNLISDKIIDFEKIDNVNYTLKIKYSLIIYLISFLIIISLFIMLKYYKIINDKIYFLLLIIIAVFSIFIRIYWASRQDMMHGDEYYSIISSNRSQYFSNANKYNKIVGFDIIKDIGFNDKTLKDALLDIKELYKDSKDSFISNIYYILLRTAFIGREAYTIKNMIITGTILNCIFYIISFIFIYKILKLIFGNNREIILPLILIFSLSEMSVSFSMFLRPYQMQEAFFVVITFIVLNTIYNNNYSVKNFILTAIIASISYLTLYSSMLFILILSAMLFINYCISYINKKNITFIKPLLEINSYKIILYYAASFISALFLSQLLYMKFFDTLLNAGNRASNSIKLPINLPLFFNKLIFCDILHIVIVLLIAAIILQKFKITKTIISNDKYKIMIFIFISALIYSVISSIISPYNAARYSGSSYILILFIIPIIIALIQSNKIIRTLVLIYLSITFLSNILTENRFNSYDNYFEKSDKNLAFDNNSNIYFYNKMLPVQYINYINTNSYCTVITNESDFSNYISDNDFYFFINTNYNSIYSNNFFKSYNFNYCGELLYGIKIYYLTKK